MYVLRLKERNGTHDWDTLLFRQDERVGGHRQRVANTFEEIYIQIRY